MYYLCTFVFFFKQKTAYEMRISDWSSDVCSSDLRCPRQRISMEVRIAEHLRQHARALHVEADIIFVGHADAAVHLDAFLNAERRRHPRHRLGDRDGGVGARIARVEQLLRLEHRRSRDLHFRIEMRRAMLERLETAERRAELVRKSTRLNSRH